MLPWLQLPKCTPPLSNLCNSLNSSCGICPQYHVISCFCLVGKHVHLSLRFSASVYIYLLTSCGQHIAPLPGDVNKGKIQSRGEREHICMQQHIRLDVCTVKK